MKTLKTRKSIVTLCTIAVLLFIVSFVAVITNVTQAAYASGDEVEKECNLVLHPSSNLLVKTVPADFVYVDFVCPVSAEYILSSINTGDISLKVLNEENQEIEFTALDSRVFLLHL